MSVPGVGVSLTTLVDRKPQRKAKPKQSQSQEGKTAFVKFIELKAKRENETLKKRKK